MAIRQVTAYGITFDVDFYATKGWAGSYWEPPEPAELIIEGIYLASQEISEVLLQSVTDEIYSQLEKDLCGEAAQAAEYQACAEYEAYVDDIERRREA